MKEEQSSKLAYKFKLLSGGVEHVKKLEHCFVITFQKGYSVVEITRVAGLKSAKYIHAALVKHGQIPSAKPGRQSKNIELPEGFAVQLKIRELSFAQWCSGWALEPDDAAGGLICNTGPIMNAIKRDFPSYYSKLTGAVVNNFASGPPFERNNFNVSFDYNGIEGCFTCEIAELKILTYGSSYQYALRLALIQRKYLETIDRLMGLPVLSNLGNQGVPW